MRGGGAAAPTDHGRARFRETAQVAGEVAGVDAELEAAVADLAWLAGVGLRTDRQRGVLDQALNDRQHPLGPDGAVGAEHGDRQVAEHGGNLVRCLAAQGPLVVGEGGLRDDGDVADVAGHGHCLGELVEVAERLQDEHVDSRGRE